jgi:hypothetical protein
MAVCDARILLLLSIERPPISVPASVILPEIVLPSTLVPAEVMVPALKILPSKVWPSNLSSMVTARSAAMEKN